ncbi:ImmA/IrrE family metallo-endopeptidase [Lactobacillus sp. S2-2]|uniref:XRE family transcriptional regulator n=1 Tax=Lactobacillus sp. S2-2 TaxID=2692917 RepID=UPI001F17F8B8|nr:XRE family transcriptional regulator [Lactobacillus sp. S2-2]MCF6515330.1 ImmA/IrrE family metallo-endopeptidase [Lactobacillus sp. S2-2]
MSFNGTRLRDVRELFNFTRKDLEKLLNLPNNTILKYENGIEEPTFAIQVKLNNLFDLKMPFFSKIDSVPKVTNYDEVSFNSKYVNDLKSKERELQFINMSDSFLREILKYLNLGKTTIVDILKEVQLMKDNNLSIDEIAKYVRESLQLDKKNNDLMSAIEKSGVFVLERGLNKKIGTYSTWTDTNRPYIILRNNKYGSDRLFDLAHEFGHLLLHRGSDFNSSDVNYIKKLKSEANYFASALLLEKDFFIQNYKRTINDPTDPKQYLQLKQYYEVSIFLIKKRARKLGLINARQSKIFYQKISKLGYDENEPYLLDIPIYIPGKIYTILNALSSNELNAIYDTFGVHEAFLYKVFLRKIEDFSSGNKLKSARVIPIEAAKQSHENKKNP